jgi:hypothetical protein
MTRFEKIVDLDGPEPAADPIDLLNHIGQEFVRLRQNNRAGAWAYLQEELMRNMGTLVPHTTSLKDLISQNIDIESFMKSAEGTKSMDPIETMAHFLNSPPPSTHSAPATTEDDDEPLIQ